MSLLGKDRVLSSSSSSTSTLDNSSSSSLQHDDRSSSPTSLDSFLSPDSLSTSNTRSHHLSRKNFSHIKILGIVSIAFGISCGWSIQGAYLTPFILTLGLPYKWASIIWLCGPISGLIIQPILGVLSDGCTNSLGRRRPFIIGGILTMISSFLMISYSTSIAQASTGALPIAIATIFFWCLDIANNSVMSPGRALITDIIPKHQHHTANAHWSFLGCVGEAIAFLICSVEWHKVLENLETKNCQEVCADLKMSVSIICVVLLSVLFITTTTAKEKPIYALKPEEIEAINDDTEEEQENGADNDNINLNEKNNPAKQKNQNKGKALSTKQKSNPFSDVFKLLCNMPLPLKKLCTFMFFAWYAWFQFIIYITTWVGQVVNKGDPHAEQGSEAYELFAKGIHAGALGLVGRSIVGGITTTSLHYLIPIFGDRNMLYVSQLVLAIGYFTTFLVPAHSLPFAIALISLFGISWGIFMTIPFVIVARISPEDSRALYVGTMNIFTCLSQLCVAVIGPILVVFLGDYNTTLVALGSGGVVGLLSLIPIAYLDLSKGVDEAITDLTTSKESNSEPSRNEEDTLNQNQSAKNYVDEEQGREVELTTTRAIVLGD